jgi:hypothetical protein
MSTISASTTTTNAYVVTADTTGTLVLQTGATPTTAVTIDTSQNVGIGTSSPTTKLNIVAASATVNAQLESGSVIGQYFASTSAGGVYLGSASAHPLVFRTNTTEAMRIDTSGNAGIGTNSPSSLLHISSVNSTAYNGAATDGQLTAGATQLISATAGANTNVAQLVFQSRASQPYNRIVSSGGSAPFMTFATNNAESMRIDSAGNTYIETGNLWRYAPAPTTMAAGANAITAAQLAGGLFNGTGATAVTMTLPLAAALDTYFASVPTTNISFDFVVVNTGTSTGIVTVTMNTGITSLGVMTVPITTSAQFRLRRTAANTYICYRI